MDMRTTYSRSPSSQHKQRRKGNVHCCLNWQSSWKVCHRISWWRLYLAGLNSPGGCRIVKVVSQSMLCRQRTVRVWYSSEQLPLHSGDHWRTAREGAGRGTTTGSHHYTRPGVREDTTTRCQCQVEGQGKGQQDFTVTSVVFTHSDITAQYLVAAIMVLHLNVLPNRSSLAPVTAFRPLPWRQTRALSAARNQVNFPENNKQKTWRLSTSDAHPTHLSILTYCSYDKEVTREESIKQALFE